MLKFSNFTEIAGFEREVFFLLLFASGIPTRYTNTHLRNENAVIYWDISVGKLQKCVYTIQYRILLPSLFSFLFWCTIRELLITKCVYAREREGVKKKKIKIKIAKRKQTVSRTVRLSILRLVSIPCVLQNKLMF